MRIVFLASCVWNYYQRLTPLCEELARRGVEVVFVEPVVYRGANSAHLTAEIPIPIPGGLKVVRRKTNLPRGVLLALYQNFANLREMIRWKPSAIVLSDATFNLLASLAARWMGIKVLLDYIDDWPEWSQVAWERWTLRRVIVPLAARLAHICVVTAELLGKDLKGYARQVIWIPNGAARMPGPLTDDRLRGGSGALFVGGLAERIDHEWIIELARRCPDVAVTVLGGGPLLPALREASKSLKNLRAPGPVSHTEAIEAMKSAAVCLIPYRRNRLTDRCFPIKLPEYWSYGKPVIATPLP